MSGFKTSETFIIKVFCLSFKTLLDFPGPVIFRKYFRHSMCLFARIKKKNIRDGNPPNFWVGFGFLQKSVKKAGLICELRFFSDCHP